MQLANEYLDGAALAGVSGSSMPEGLGAKVEEVCCKPACNASSSNMQTVDTPRSGKPVSDPTLHAL